MKEQNFWCKKCGNKLHTDVLDSLIGMGYTVELECTSCYHVDHYHESEQDDPIEGLNVPRSENSYVTKEEADEYYLLNESQRKKDIILYQMARLMRDTDGIHPSTKGPMVGDLLMRLRMIDGPKYDQEVINPLPKKDM